MIYHGDGRERMAAMEPVSVDAIVTDPPYGLSFMGKDWDHGVPGVHFWQEAYRVLKPGGHLVAFGGTRTHHRLMVAIEDAGFEIRDCLMWLYGSGFPKSHDVSKAIDKTAGAEREVLRIRTDGRKGGGARTYDDDAYRWDKPFAETAPATDAAREWQGWGTALKPAWEPIILARKPLAGTVASNVLDHGTGALNIDGCRIDYQSDSDRAESEGKNQHTRYKNPGSNRDSYSGDYPPRTDYDGSRGRWPANLILDESAAALLDAQSGERPGCKSPSGARPESKYRPNQGAYQSQGAIYPDTGGASRFFYCAKASRSERGEGNTHPTVKPINLMRWLVRLVAPPGGLILDPFCGSGSTLVAAQREGFRAIGIELEPAYVEIASRRIVADAPLFEEIPV